MKNVPKLNAFQLKCIALFCMTLDHIHVFLSPLFPLPLLLRMAGRIAAPLFLFLTGWGFSYTHSRPRYLLRMYLFSALMTLCNALVNARFPHPPGDAVQNDIFTSLFLVLYVLYFLDKIFSALRVCAANGRQRAWGGCLAPALRCALCAAALFAPFFLGELAPSVPSPAASLVLHALFPSPLYAEGGPWFIALGVAMYYSRKRPFALCIVYAAFSAMTPGLQSLMILALPLMLLYSGEKGRDVKYFFYYYYPFHIYVLFILGCLLKGSV